MEIHDFFSLCFLLWVKRTSDIMDVGSFVVIKYMYYIFINEVVWIWTSSIKGKKEKKKDEKGQYGTSNGI